MTLTFLATITVKPEYMEEACQAVTAICPATRAESGCIAFEPRRHADGSSTITIFEEWTGREAFDYHHAQDYTKDVFAKYQNWLASDPVLVEVKPLEG
ncbi:putative quinol monooxygenase [Qipengyuania sp. ASV99]|uniref:putative quinol monooxygenase n=1 Tax=Qipengyuania sp. ASV99 TaxID=3399681 RepID=UPI003A4C8035